MKRAIRLQNIPPYPFARWAACVRDAQRQGVDVICLDIGNPDMPPADEVIDVLCQSAHRPDYHGYPGYRGIPALLEAVAGYYERRFGVLLDPQNQVLPLVGSKAGIILIALALLDPGDVVLVPNPGYAPYATGTALAGARAHTFPLLAEHSFLPDLDAIPSSVADEAVLMWLNYPNNPTGATADLEFLTQAVEFARRHNLLLCHDAPYCDVTYDGYIAPSVLQVGGASEVTVEFNSLSKTCNMAGWRVGWAVGNADALASLAQLESSLNSGIYRPLQEASVQALSVAPEWFSARDEVYRERLGIIVQGLNAAGMAVPNPRATLYVWTRIPSGWASSEEFALALLKQTGVSVAPGSFFGPAGEGYVRIAATAPTERVREAMERFRRFAM